MSVTSQERCLWAVPVCGRARGSALHALSLDSLESLAQSGLSTNWSPCLCVYVHVHVHVYLLCLALFCLIDRLFPIVVCNVC